jgi:hypothetical protein
LSHSIISLAISIRTRVPTLDLALQAKPGAGGISLSVTAALWIGQFAQSQFALWRVASRSEL